MRAEVEQLMRLTDPIERSARALVVMEEARDLQATMARIRGLAVYEVYTAYGAAKAARLLGISRAGLYRIIGEHAPPEVKEARRDKAIFAAIIALIMIGVAQGIAPPQSLTDELPADMAMTLQEKAAANGTTPATTLSEGEEPNE